MKTRLVTSVLLVAAIGAIAAPRGNDGDWRNVGGDPGAQRFSALTQIMRQNVRHLRQTWAVDTGAHDLQTTPLVVDGTMYVTAGRRIVALEPETGNEIWTYEAGGPVSRRGVAYWPGDGKLGARVYSGAGDGLMVALDARSGVVAGEFGTNGLVDLKESVRGDVDGPFMLNSPPVVYRDIVITGGANSEGEPSFGLYGDIRGWDARTGKRLWSFHTVPRAGEPGVETWEGESWKNRSGTNAWSLMTVDVERGLVFAPTGSPTPDFYGADRRGKNLYGNTLLALDARTGTLQWFHQLVHHDLWDFDLPAAPTLIDVVRPDGREVAAVAMLTKMSTLFVFDRVTGEPLFGMEERPVPQSDVPGEATWPTQPFPVQPPPLARTTFDPETDFYALTPEHAAYCRDLWNTHRMYTRGIFTPPSLDRTMVMFPSTLGGGNWSGLSYDASRALVFTNIMNLGQVARMIRTDRQTGAATYARTSPWGSAYGRFWNPETKVPCSAPPFGELVAVDVNRAAVAWRVPLGTFPELAARGFDRTGTPNIGGTIATATGLVFIGGTIDGRFRAFDADTGETLWETTLEAAAHATPMTFQGRDGRQYVVVAAGGNGLLASPPGSKIVAFALPR